MMLRWHPSQLSKYHLRLKIALELVVKGVRKVVSVLLWVVKVARHVGYCAISVVVLLWVLVGIVVVVTIVFLTLLVKMIMI